VSSADAAPSRASIAYFGELKARLADLLGQLKGVLDTELADFNRTVAEQGVPPVTPPPPASAPHGAAETPR
jgi:hypothetical protein